jgi:hypothetical protein
MATQSTNITVKLRNVRGSFLNVFTPRPDKDDPTKKPKFGANALLNKVKHAPQIAAVEKAIEQLLKEKKWARATVKSFPLGEASSKINSSTNEPYQGYDENHMYLTANHTRRPLVVALDGSALSESDGKPYSGCYINMNVDVYAYDKDPKHGRRICASLRSVQFVAEGEPFGGGENIDASKEFDDVDPNEVPDNDLM